MIRVARALAPLSIASVVLAACGGGAPPGAREPAAAPGGHALPEEKRLADMRQLTLEGENAEAYWAFGRRELVLQRRAGDAACDRIYRMPLAGFLPGDPPREGVPPLVPVSSGDGATTCAYFFPGDREVLYASTHLGGAACPPKPDHSQGYVWPLYDTFDIFKANADGSNVRRLTEAPGYDAEGTVCAKDGSIVFTSVRDGDLELYRMDADGTNVKRLTNEPGYDGGAFFNADCSRIVWRASRPRPGKELEDYQRLLRENLVRPSKLEIWTANADGSDARQITYLDAASFAPYWHPSQKRLLFSTNWGDPKGREFDIWAVDESGAGLERVTYAGGFDGFPMFSPDGALLAFSSNRATAPGRHDTNVFVARWVEDAKTKRVETAADRVLTDVTWLADPAREGRGVGTKGLVASGAFLEERFRELGAVPEGDRGTFREAFPVVTELKRGASSRVELGGGPLPDDAYVVMGYSPEKAQVTGELAFAGYGIVAKDLGIDDYAKLDVKKKVVVVRRFVPDGGKLSGTEAQRRYGDIRRKAWLARERGAAALVVVDDPAPPPGAKSDWKGPDEAKLPPLMPEGYADAGLPVLVVKRAVGRPLIERLRAKARLPARIEIELTKVASEAFNVVGRIEAAAPEGRRLPGVVVVGAHYDHLGRGGRHSLSPHSEEAHVGADDNASGTAVLLEVMRAISKRRGELRRDVVFAAFSAEESGVLGSAHFVQKRVERGGKLPGVYAMLNMDMVGRMRENRLQVLGAETAREWPDLVGAACDAARVRCALSGDGYGPSDQINFYTAGVPVVHLFTGTHSDYHKPSDTADKVNAAGAAQVGAICTQVAVLASRREAPLTYNAGIEGPVAHGDMRSFNASLGTIPDYGGPGPGKKGVLLAGVRPGGAAEKGGMRKGDVLVRLAGSEIASVEDFMFVLTSRKPGETVQAVVVRDGKEVELEVTFQEGHRMK
jgi:hypothetical protein